jgi:hypothetical protein
MEGLDQLQPLVHQGRAIDRDLGAHRPIGVGDGFAGGGRAHLLEAPVPERSAAGGEDDPPNALGTRRVEALEDGIMLGINREQGRSAAPGGFDHQLAGRDQGFLIGEGNRSSAPYRRHGRAEAGRSDDRRHRPVRAGTGGIEDRLVARGGLGAASGQSGAKRFDQGFVGDHRPARPDPPRCVRQTLDVPMGGDGQDLVTLRIALDQVERGAADGAGCPEDGDASPPGHARLAIRTSNVARMTGNRPSSRSSTPP